MDERKLRVLLRHRGALAGAAILFLLILVAAGATVFSPHDPHKQVAGKGAEGPSAVHWLGTDHGGRDILTRLSHAAWLSLLIGVTAVAFSAVVGSVVGATAGFFGGWADALTMRLVDIMMAFPRILLAILIASLMGKGTWSVILAVGITGMPSFARQIRGSVLAIREMEYVAASRAIGSNPWRTLFVHVIPNAFGPIVVLATLGIGGAVLDAAGLSFLGLGVELDQPEWGVMLHHGRRDLELSPWLAVSAGAAITLTVLSFNLLGDGVRDALDPRSR